MAEVPHVRRRRGAPLAAGADVPQRLGRTAQQVSDTVATRIAQGDLAPGDKLPPERYLATTHGVSRSTLRQALISLESRGLLRREPGRGGGTFVASAKVYRDLSQITGVPTLLREQGFTSGSRVVSLNVRPADRATAAELGITVSDHVVDLVRIRFADGAPMSLERAMLPIALVPGLPELALGGSLYALLDEQFGIRAHEAIEHIEVVAATDDEAQILAIAPGAPLLLVRRTTTDAQGRPFEFSRDLFRGDRVRISVRIQGSDESEAARLRRIVRPRPVG